MENEASDNSNSYLIFFILPVAKMAVYIVLPSRVIKVPNNISRKIREHIRELFSTRDVGYNLLHIQSAM